MFRFILATRMPVAFCCLHCVTSLTKLFWLTICNMFVILSLSRAVTYGCEPTTAEFTVWTHVTGNFLDNVVIVVGGRFGGRTDPISVSTTTIFLEHFLNKPRVFAVLGPQTTSMTEVLCHKLYIKRFVKCAE